jgi:hypothetical protein
MRGHFGSCWAAAGTLCSRSNLNRVALDFRSTEFLNNTVQISYAEITKHIVNGSSGGEVDVARIEPNA